MLHFSSELNTLIGIRGSGKSSILEAVRYALDIPRGEKAQDTKYKDELIRHTLGSGGKVTLTACDVYGQEFTISRIFREAQAMARVSHPNVVQVYEVGEVDGQVFIAMEFIEGTTLGTWQKQSERSWDEVLRMYLEAGQGLLAAHRVGLVHRDFKPEHIAAPRRRVIPSACGRAAAGGAADAIWSRLVVRSCLRRSGLSHSGRCGPPLLCRAIRRAAARARSARRGSASCLSAHL